MADAMRTPSGAPSQKARDTHGGSHGEYPVFDHKSAHDALQLRGHAPDPAKIIAKVRAWANEHGDKAILAECDAAAEKDRNSTENRSDEVPKISTEVETRSSNVAIDGVSFPDRTITLIAVPDEQPAAVMFNNDMWNEVFSRTAFDGLDKWLTSPRARSIPATASLVIPNPNHDNGQLIGRIVEARSGTVDGEEGLVTKVQVAKTSIGNDTLELASERAVSPSVGFQIKNPNRDQRLDRYTKTRRIDRAFLHHLSFVAEPAYSGARILSVRSEDDPSIASPLATPLMDQFINDPIMQWANGRTNTSSA
jgi:HK97 family phage prohead protease